MPRRPDCVARWSANLTVAASESGNNDQISAAVPVTKGVAALVPPE